jgi:hypothetical protein
MSDRDSAVLRTLGAQAGGVRAVAQIPSGEGFFTDFWGMTSRWIGKVV